MLLPGPPSELKAMFAEHAYRGFSEFCRPRDSNTFYRVAGMPESDLDQLIAPSIRSIRIRPLRSRSGGDIQIHLRARCDTGDEAEALLAEVGTAMEHLLAIACIRAMEIHSRPL